MVSGKLMSHVDEGTNLVLVVVAAAVVVNIPIVLDSFLLMYLG